MTLKEMAQSALDVQTACNLSGVARSFAEVMSALRASADCTGTEWANTHPVARLYAEQIAHLSGAGPGDPSTYSAAYDKCVEWANYHE